MTQGQQEADLLQALELDDSYHVERVLGEGPTGRTELVTLDGDGPFVRKRIPVELANPEAWARLATIDEPLLPKVERTYSLPDAFVVVSDYVEGDSLEGRVHGSGPLASDDAICIIRDVAHATDVLHAHGIVHRDITPSNVVLAADGAHLIDLGISRIHTQGAQHDTTRMGTWGFAAPEQYGFAQTDARSDVYSLGCLLAFMLTGICPDEPGYEEALADQTHVSPPLHAAIEHACAFEPSKRPQTAGAFADEAQAALTGGTEGLVTDEPADVPEASTALRDDAPLRGARRVLEILSSWRVWLVVGIVLTAAVLGSGFIMSGFDTDPTTSLVMRVYDLFFVIVLSTSVAFVPAWELSRAILMRGPYEEEKGRWWRLLKRLVRSVLTGLVLITAVAVIISLVRYVAGS